MSENEEIMRFVKTDHEVDGVIENVVQQRLLVVKGYAVIKHPATDIEYCQDEIVRAAYFSSTRSQLLSDLVENARWVAGKVRTPSLGKACDDCVY